MNLSWLNDLNIPPSRVVVMSIRLECTKTELQLASTHNEYRNLMSCYIVVHIHIQNLIYFHISDFVSIKFPKKISQVFPEFFQIFFLNFVIDMSHGQWVINNDLSSL